LARIVSPAIAERLIADGTCDMVAMVRANIADPDLPSKLAAGRVRDVRPCVGDSTGCIDRIINGEPMRCIYNPASGREREWATIDRAPVSRRVLVVGGGPAGLEAARVASQRGHQVTLFERADELGGAVRVTARQPGREEMGRIGRWLAEQVRALGVDVRLKTAATLENVRAERPDVVILATGARGVEPAARPGTLPVVSAWAVLNGDVEAGRNVLVVYHTGQQAGCAVAELVA